MTSTDTAAFELAKLAMCDPSSVTPRSELAHQLGEEARKASLLNPCKLMPALDAAVHRYLAATKPKTADMEAVKLARRTWHESSGKRLCR